VRQVVGSFADPAQNCTKSVERPALDFSRSITILDVASQSKVGSDLIKEIENRISHASITMEWRRLLFGGGTRLNVGQSAISATSTIQPTVFYNW
jgi:hypothetical protein